MIDKVYCTDGKHKVYKTVVSKLKRKKPFGSTRRRWEFTFKKILKRYDVRLWTVRMRLTSVPVAGCHEQSLSGSTRGRYLTR